MTAVASPITQPSKPARPYFSALWRVPAATIADRAAKLHHAAGIAANDFAALHGKPASIFFRADDVAVPSAMNTVMFTAFIRNNVPLAPALVPAWLNEARWEVLQALAAHAPHLWAWHQHGWRHRNAQREGKKGEFGSHRTYDAKEADIRKGRDKLHRIAGSAMCPVFTPPWNRMDEEALNALVLLGFKGVSRTVNARPLPPEGLKDISVNVDLHTRRETSPDAGWQALTDELCAAISTGQAGIMLHHQRMNAAAAAFLNIFLAFAASHPCLDVVDIRKAVLS
ncbi:polysaccharide deacetylase [Oleidesulfovibrio sp.]|uniref:polysaccharide deacetylase n=1 Tax=Oleidesulfovibrio sp. TaxID=2909707 RepID=UPI003A87A78C